MSRSPATRILDAWVELEKALRSALPFCSVAPPTQPSELLAALRINHRIGAQEEARILALRETRNRIAHDPGEPDVEEAATFEDEARRLMATLKGTDACGPSTHT
jgi:hypothetical protein